MPNIKILVAEDDPHIRMGLVDTLESEGYEVAGAGDGRQALELFEKGAFDLIMLDIMMPQVSGYDVCRQIRKTDEQVPVIMLTAKGEEIDKVVGLKLGADDYITKPFGVHELLARIAAVLRRSGLAQKPREQDSKAPFAFGPFEVNPKTFKLAKDGKHQDISERELTLIRYFADHPGEVLNRDDLLNAGWGIDYMGTTRTLDQHIAQLRKKIETDPAHPVLITTVHGVGYRYNG
jgi:DNA-binding response OmpR family regulator